MEEKNTNMLETNEETVEKTVEEVATETPVNTAPSNEKRCAHCQALMQEDQVFCPECGAPQKKLCQQCGAELKEGQAFCDKCGQRADISDGMDQNAAINQFNTQMQAQAQKNKNTPKIIGGICAAVVILAVLFGSLGGGVNFAKQFADIASEEWCTISSDGSYMELDTNPDDIDSDSYKFDYVTFFAANEAIEKVNKELGFGDSLYQKMNTTTWSQGKQFDENEKVRVTWTYHPDKGLEVMYEKK